MLRIVGGRTASTNPSPHVVGFLLEDDEKFLLEMSDTTVFDLLVPYLDIPPIVKTAPHVLGLLDRGKSIDTDSAVTIPANSATAFMPGATIMITNVSSSPITVDIIDDDLYLGGTNTTGTRTIAEHGVATLRKTGTTTWVIFGVGVS